MANAQTSPRTLALVTGASGGLGADFAVLLAADKYNLVLVARSGAPMETLATKLQAEHGTTCHILTTDLARIDAASTVASFLDENRLRVDVLINNAGFGDNDPFAKADETKLSEMTTLNVTTLTNLTRKVLPGMIERRSGRIMLLGSTASFQPGPNMAVYCATKAYVLSFGEALAFELKGSGVSVTTVCPGVTATGFQKAAALRENSAMLKAGIMASRDVARQGYAAMKAGKPVVVTGVSNVVSTFMGRYLPHSLVLPLGAKFLAK